MMNNPFLKASFYFALSLIFVLMAVFLSDKITDNPAEIDEIKTVIRPVVSCPTDFVSFEETKKKVVLAQEINSYAIPEENNFVGENINLKRTGLKSQIACGYLFYRVSVGDRPIIQKDENLFIGLINQYGGHIFSGHILPGKDDVIVNRDKDNKTEVLIPLNEVVYDGTSRTNLKRVDWASLLNVSDEFNFEIALNTTSKSGRLDLVEIAYKCWNPRTGEETEDCFLEAQ